MSELASVVLYRPVGQAELELVAASGWKQFPPRLPGQPFFYPVVTEEYAIQIARDWNTKDSHSGYVGYVLRFNVCSAYLAQFNRHTAGGLAFQEYWIPAEQLEDFNRNIVGEIKVIHKFESSADK